MSFTACCRSGGPPRGGGGEGHDDNSICFSWIQSFLLHSTIPHLITLGKKQSQIAGQIHDALTLSKLLKIQCVIRIIPGAYRSGFTPRVATTHHWNASFSPTST